MQKYILRDGNEIPCIGVGTGLIKGVADDKVRFIYRLFKEKVKDIFIPGFKESNHYPLLRDAKKDRMVPVVLDAYLDSIDTCLVDTVRAYIKSEAVLGNIMKKKNIKPFIVSKITNTHQRENTERECLNASLENLSVDCLDVYMLHWPQSGTFVKSYKKLIEFRNEGKIKSIGVANFNIEHLEELKANGLELPMVNEFECHPYLQQQELVQYCKVNGIQVIAYAPTGHKIFEFAALEKVKGMCSKYKVAPSQIIMRWHYQNGIIPIFNTTSVEHLKENLDIFKFSLNDEEMAFINSLDCNDRYWPNPANCDFKKL